MAKRLRACMFCGIPHRYGSTDQNHDYVPSACINSLSYKVKELKAEIRQLKKQLKEAA